MLTLITLAVLLSILVSQTRAAESDPVAASYSLKPASLASLTLPSTAIPSATAAQRWVEENWGYVEGTSGNMAFVDDPYESANKEKVLRVEYKKGTYAEGPAGSGGVTSTYLNPFGEGVQRAMFTYEVAFSEDWDFVKGGKLLGLFGGRIGEACAGGQFSDKCFSIRVMWRADGDGELYTYNPGYKGFESKDGIKETAASYGFSVSRGSWKFTIGQWQKISLVVVLNSDPSSTSTEANGILAVHVDDKEIFTHDFFIFTTDSAVDITSIFFSTFFGGHTEEWASKGGFAYFRNMKTYYGTEAATGTSDLQTPLYTQ